jgi:hypothetical protein
MLVLAGIFEQRATRICVRLAAPLMMVLQLATWL